MRARTALALVATAGLCATTIAGSPLQGQGRGGGAAPPRARSITLGDVTAFEAKDNVTTVSAGPDQIRILFYRDDLFRLWLGPDGQFTEAQPNAADAQMVVWKGAPIAVTSRDAGDYYRVESAAVVLRVYKRPLRFAMFDKANTTVIWQETKPLTYGPSTIQTLKRGDNENFYGGGMQNGYFSHRDTSLNVRLNTRGWNDGATPNPAPFYMSTAGYGVFRNTMTPGRYDFLSPMALSHDESRFDAYYFYGPSLKKILDGYTQVTGRPFMLPRWGLGFGDSDCYNKTGKTIDVVKKVAEVYRANDMPGAWIMPNDGYGCGYTDLPQTIQALAPLGFHTGLWTENGLERIATEVRDYGSRVMKLDVAWIGRGYQFALNGMRDAYEGIEKNADARGFVWTTCAWAGGQRYSTIWSGDQSGNWEYIRFHIPTVIGAGLSGFNAATGDVDGIFGGSAQTQVRDLQWKAFTPAWMIISGWSKQTNNMKQPWIFGEPYTTINRKYLKLKQRLTPYLYTYSREAFDTRRADRARDGARVPERSGDVVEAHAISVHVRRMAARRARLPGRAGSRRHLPARRQVDRLLGRHGVQRPDDAQRLRRAARQAAALRQSRRDHPDVSGHALRRPEAGRSGHARRLPVGQDDVLAVRRRRHDAEVPRPARSRGRRSTSSRRRRRTPRATRSPSTWDPRPASTTACPAAAAYLVDVHATRKPAKVTVGGRALAEIPQTGQGRQAQDKLKADFEAATEGWYYDAADRRGVLHVKLGPQALSKGFSVVIGL